MVTNLFRHHFFTHLIALSVAFVSFTEISVAAEPTIDTLKPESGVFLMRVNGKRGNTNTLLIKGAKAVFLIDPNFDKSVEALQKAIQDQGVSKIDYLSISHTHFDHMEQIPAFAGDGVTTFLTADQKARLDELGFLKAVSKAEIISKKKIDLGGITVEAVSLPEKVAHTTGDLVFYIKEAKALYVGDYLFTNGYPIIDRNLGSLTGYQKNLDFILSAYGDDTVILPGHSSIAPLPAKTFTMAEYRNWVTLLKQSVCQIKASLAAGKTTDQIIEAGLGKKFASFMDNPVFIRENRWINYVAAQKGNTCLSE